MKRLFVGIALSALWLTPAHAAESIPSFDTSVVVNTDSTLSVTETVVYDMDAVQRHGLERIIPKTSENGPRIVVRDVTATRDGIADTVNLHDGPDTLTVRIGKSDVTISGVHSYVLSYTVLNEVRYFDNRDEVYWNAIPQGMNLPIAESRATLQFPEGATLFGRPACYTGAAGSVAVDCRIASRGMQVTATALRPFEISEGMTIAAAIAPGVITRVTPVEASSGGSGSSFGFTWALIAAAFVIIIVLLGIFYGLSAFVSMIWKALFGYNSLPRHRADGGEILVQYDPPKGCSSPEASYMASPTRAGSCTSGSGRRSRHRSC